MGTLCCIAADPHGWGSHVSSPVGSCSNTLDAEPSRVDANAANAFQLPVRSPDCCHMDLLWVDACLRQLIIKLILSRVRSKGPVCEKSPSQEKPFKVQNNSHWQPFP